MGILTEWITEWLKGLLIEGIMGNLEGLFDTVNTRVGEISVQVGTTPAAWNAGVFSLIRQLSETVILPIAGLILTFVATYELIQMILEKNNMHEFDVANIYKWVFKTTCAILILSNTFNIVMAVFDVSQSVIASAAGIVTGATNITPDMLAKFPDVLTVTKADEDLETVSADLCAVAEQALEAYNAMRAVEGRKLAEDIGNRLTYIEDYTAHVEKRSPETVAEYRAKLETTHLPDNVREKLNKELSRLAKQPFGSSESSVLHSYLDVCLELPWGTYTKERLNVDAARKVLDREHFGLEKVKERILETIAVRQMNPEGKGQIICLAGPPGVGKTSIALSVAKALNRKLSRISLGGVRDEADIRGHRKTYIGAMPGRIVEAISRSGAMNPLLVLDEIDKLSGDYRGDPASALLEALDSEQNHAFRDHFLEIPLDLSQVMFITTANSLDTIPRPLLDRMEVIQLSSYTDEEKLQIAKNHLLPKQMKEHGLKKGSLRIDEETLRAIIRDYTRESGVRQLERRLAAVCRKADMQLLSKTVKRVTVTEKDLPKLLDMQPYPPTVHVEQEEIGVVNGLAWTEAGGEILEVEVNVMEGSGKLELTGNLGDVMKESAQAALSCLRSRAEALGIDPDFYKTKDIHVHFPEGAVPKDGPSAGIAMATALLSALTNRKIKAGIAMTGEVTLRGRVLPIGGLKEKTMAAKRYGIHTVLIPKDNARDLEEIDQTVRAALRFIPVETVDQVFAEVFCPSRVETKADAIPAFLPVENSKEAALRQ